VTRRWREIGIAVAGAGVVVALVLVLLQVIGSDEPAEPVVMPTQTTSSTTSKKPEPPRPTQWPRGLVVKVDNTSAARPHVGLRMANLIFVEPVEGGLTRMAAVYWGKRPGAIGPVRSARETDIQLLSQLKQPILTFSGAAPEVYGLLNKAPLSQATPTTQPSAWYRVAGRTSPYNLFVNPAKLPKTKPVPSPLLFGKAPAGGKRIKRLHVSFQAASYDFRWSGKKQSWMITLDGRPLTTVGHGQMGASTVVVQEVKIGDGKGVSDASGAASPVAKTVGRGEATVLRDGKAYATEWSRPKLKQETAYRLENGKRVPFDKGRVMILLVPKFLAPK